MAQQAGPAPIPVQQVFATLEAALSVDNATRAAAEALLREWEGDAAPGFIGSLLKVVAEVQAVPEVSAATHVPALPSYRVVLSFRGVLHGRHEHHPVNNFAWLPKCWLAHAAHPLVCLAHSPACHPCLQEGRLMAAVVAKNAVGSSWRKTLGSREWSRVPGGLPPLLSRSIRIAIPACSTAATVAHWVGVCIGFGTSEAGRQFSACASIICRAGTSVLRGMRSSCVHRVLAECLGDSCCLLLSRPALQYVRILPSSSQLGLSHPDTKSNPSHGTWMRLASLPCRPSTAPPCLTCRRREGVCAHNCHGGAARGRV